jgi:hypothetical protein
MESFARAAQGATTIYLVGGTTAVLVGWRDSTVDIDFLRSMRRRFAGRSTISSRDLEVASSP